MCLLSLDIGTTAVKAVVFDPDGAIRAQGLREYELLKPAPEGLELDCETYWQASVAAIRQALAAGAARPAAIRALGVTSQGETLVLLDRQGRPLRPAIVWLDTRSQAEAEELAGSRDPAEVYRVTGQQEIIPAWTATRILWLRRHEPEILKRTARFLLVGDYLLYRLTGRLVSDRALNPSTLYYDLRRRDWWPEMLAVLGVRREQLPELLDSGSVVGPLTAAAAAATGLDRRTLAVCAPLDQVAAAVGAGNLEPGLVTENTGAALALGATLAQPVYDPRRRLGLYAHALRDRYLLLPWAPTAGMALRWFRDAFGGGRDYAALCREAESVPPGADGLLMLPHLAGAGCPECQPRARGMFHGLTLAHRRAHCTRAILEAVACMLRGNLELLAELGVAAQSLRALGGATRSALWLQIKADVCRRELQVLEDAETTGRGAAMLAGTAAGLFPDLFAARAAMVRVARTVTPDTARAAAYEEIYRRYRELNRSYNAGP